MDPVFPLMVKKFLRRLAIPLLSRIFLLCLRIHLWSALRLAMCAPKILSLGALLAIRRVMPIAPAFSVLWTRVSIVYLFELLLMRIHRFVWRCSGIVLFMGMSVCRAVRCCVALLVIL